MRAFRGWACGIALALTATAAASAQEAPIPAARLALAQDVVEATGAKAAVARAMDAMVTQMAKGMQVSVSDPQMAAYLDQLLRQEMVEIQAKMTPLYAAIYARTFDEQQLGELLAFYRSSTGRMLVAKSPELSRQSLLAVQPLIPQMQRDMVIKMFDHVCEVRSCTPEQRQKLSGVEAATLDRIAHPAPAPGQP